MKPWLNIAAACLLCSCATETRFDRPVAAAPAGNDCKVDFFRKPQKPQRAYELITKAESHVQKNFFFGGTATLEDDAYSELRTQACKIGADAVIVDDFIASQATEFSHVYVWASLVRYTAVAQQ